MKALVHWKEEMQLSGECNGQTLAMDAKSPIGKGLGFTPKELVAIGIGGCTAMDVIALLKKHKQELKSLEVETEAEQTTGVQPAVFKTVHLIFRATGAVEKGKLMEAVELSQSKYCGVSAMIAHSAKITFSVELNGETIGSGEAKF